MLFVKKKSFFFGGFLVFIRLLVKIGKYERANNKIFSWRVNGR